MKIFFKNLGIIITFLGLVPFLVMIGESFKLETALIGIFILAVGITLFLVNKE